MGFSFFEHSNPDDLDFISNSKEAPNRPQIQRILLTRTPAAGPPQQLQVWTPSLYGASYATQESWREYTWWSAVKETHRLPEFTVHTQTAHNSSASPWVPGLAMVLTEYPSHFLVLEAHANPIGKQHLR